MNHKILPLKLKPGDHKNNDQWDDNQSVDTFIPPEDKAIFKRISRIVQSTPGLISDKDRELPEDIREEIRSGELDETATAWINDWKSANDQSAEKEGSRSDIRDFVSSSLNEPDTNTGEVNDPAANYGSKRGHRIRFTAYAASVAAAVIFGAFLLFRPFSVNDTPEELYARYYQPFNLVNIVTRGTDIPSDESLSKAIESYKRQDYDQALVLFRKTLAANPSSNSALFFYGITNLASGDAESAISSLENVAVNKEDFATEATWYLGLAYLKSGQKEKALVCFDELSASSEYYGRKAGEIIGHLR